MVVANVRERERYIYIDCDQRGGQLGPPSHLPHLPLYIYIYTYIHMYPWLMCHLSHAVFRQLQYAVDKIPQVLILIIKVPSIADLGVGGRKGR